MLLSLYKTDLFYIQSVNLIPKQLLMQLHRREHQQIYSKIALLRPKKHLHHTFLLTIFLIIHLSVNITIYHIFFDLL